MPLPAPDKNKKFFEVFSLLFAPTFLWEEDDYIPCLDRASLQNSTEDPFFRHDALPGLLVYGAAGMAFLSDLRHLKNRVAHRKPGADRECDEVQSFCGDVLGEIAGVHIEPESTHLFDAFQGQETYLPVPFSGVGIADDAVVLPYLHLTHGCFPFPFVMAYADRNHPSRSHGHPPTWAMAIRSWKPL